MWTLCKISGRQSLLYTVYLPLLRLPVTLTLFGLVLFPSLVLKLWSLCHLFLTVIPIFFFFHVFLFLHRSAPCPSLVPCLWPLLITVAVGPNCSIIFLSLLSHTLVISKSQQWQKGAVRQMLFTAQKPFVLAHYLIRSWLARWLHLLCSQRGASLLLSSMASACHIPSFYWPKLFPYMTGLTSTFL